MDKFPDDFCYSAVAATTPQAAAEVSVEDAKKLRLSVYSKLMDGVSKGRKYICIPCVHGVYSEFAIATVLVELVIKFPSRVYVRWANTGVFVKIPITLADPDRVYSALGIVMTDDPQPDILPQALFLSA